MLYAGRLSREKDVELLAGAFCDVVDAGRQARLVVAGDGPLREQLELLVERYPATFLGFVAQEELARVYRDADLLVFPSTTDTQGLVVLEAQASGLPVIVTDHGGPQEVVVDGETALVVPGGHRPALARAMIELLDDPARRRRMGTAARYFIQERVGDGRYGEAILDSLGVAAPPHRRFSSVAAALRQLPLREWTSH